MGALLLVAGLILTAPAQGADSQRAFATPATEAVVRRAMARHAQQDSSVRDFTATFRTRLTVAFGRRRWARVPPMGVEEQTGLIRWQAPDDIQIEVQGRRSVARSPDMEMRSVFSEPWFVPRALGDSVQVMGADFPERPALHPLAADGPDWYRYTLLDSVLVTGPDGRSVPLLRLSVAPRRAGIPLVLGYLVLDGNTGDVTRFSFRFVGVDLWVRPDEATAEDSADARTANKWIDRLLSLNLDLEYSLQEGTHWLPYRQMVAGSLEIPFVGDAVLPFSFTTVFDDYEVNTGRPIVFRAPPPIPRGPEYDSLRAARRDSLRAEREARRARGESDSLAWRRGREATGTWGEGGRYEVHIPPADSMDHYAAWPDSLKLDDPNDDTREQRQILGELAGMAEGLPRGLGGGRSPMLAVEKFADVLHYNRVQGLSLGLGWRAPFFSVPFTEAFASGRFGIADQRLYGRLALRRDAPGGRWTLAGYRDLVPDDPFVRPKAIANSVNSLFTGHDEADYLIAQGASLTYETSLATGLEFTLGGRVEDQGSAAREIRSVFTGGDFTPNPAVAEGAFAGATARLEGRTGLARWALGADLLAPLGTPTLRDSALTGADPVAKLYGEWRQRVGAGRMGFSVTARAGASAGGDLPQAAFRLGGLATVRGFPYGAVTGAAFWSAQVDVPLKRGDVRPVVFADAGQAGPVRGLAARPVLAGAGAGLSFFGGIFRMDLSWPVYPTGGRPRFDLVFGAPR